MALIFLLFPFSVAAQIGDNWFEVRNCSELNTAAGEFAPSMNYAENLLYFNSTRNGISHFYSVAVTSEITFLKAREASGTLNSARSNRSYISFLANDEAYLSGFRPTPRNSVLNIFKSTFKNGSWLEPQPVAELAEDEFTAHPAMSQDGKFMIFSSLKAGGQGGTDLWISRRQENGQWNEAINLGEKLNSEHDEITPFIAGNDTLFFASNGFGGKGGFEIFISVLSGGEWQAPVALSGLNTPANESDFILLNNNTALYASDKPGGAGGLDLYVAQVINQSAWLHKNDVELSFKANVENVVITRDDNQTALIPLIPYVFFKSSSAELPEEFLKNDGNNFTEEGVGNFQEGYRNLLNIIGRRLKQYPASKLVIEGWSTEGVSGAPTAALSRERVQSVAGFLKQQWNITDEQLVLGFHELPRSSGLQKAESRRVELSSDDSRILQPLEARTSSVSVMPELISLEADARPRNMIKEWKIMANEVMVSDGARELPGIITLPLQRLEADFEKQSLRFELSATDTAGNVFKTPLDINIQHVSVSPGKTTGTVQRSLMFFLKIEDIQKDPAVVKLSGMILGFKSPHTVFIRHLDSFESRLRAEILLKELARNSNSLVNLQLQPTASITGLPPALLPLADYAVEIRIEESF